MSPSSARPSTGRAALSMSARAPPPTGSPYTLTSTTCKPPNRNQPFDRVTWIKADCIRKIEKFHYIDSTLSALDRCNERLVAPQPLGYLSLCQSSLFPLFNKQGPKRL